MSEQAQEITRDGNNAGYGQLGAAGVQADQDTSEYLTIIIAGQRFGIPVLQVQDVLGAQAVTHIPLAPPQVAGSLNLRGRIVTALNVRRCLGLEDTVRADTHMSVVVEYEGELYSLVIDKVGDVLSLSDKKFEKNPATLDKVWREVSLGIYQMENELLVILDVPKLISTIRN